MQNNRFDFLLDLSGNAAHENPILGFFSPESKSGMGKIAVDDHWFS